MKIETSVRLLTACAILSLTIFLAPANALAHCDGLDGPVVKAAQKALESGNVNLVLIWVQREYEKEIRIAFQNTLEVRELAPEAMELADSYFFETLVRLHRAGEGEPYTGLKPAGRDLGPAIPAADKALAEGSARPLLKLLTQALQAGVLEQFRQVMARKDYDEDDVQAGRDYVEAYVPFLQYIERIYETVANPGDGHPREFDEARLTEEKRH